MSLSNHLRRLGFIVLTLGGAAALGACTLTPVYSGRLAESPMLNLAYARPASRLEQIVYQDLALRLGASNLATAPFAKVTMVSGTGETALSQTADPAKPIEVTIMATLRITRRDGTDAPPLLLTRRATANFTRTGQVLADREAETDAAERAATAVAESLRLAVLTSLVR